MAVIYLLSSARLKQETELHGNVDEKVLKRSIIFVQDSKIEPVIGTKLMDKLKTLIETEIDNPGDSGGIEHSSNSKYKTLLVDKIEPVMLQFSVEQSIPFMDLNLSNKGLIEREGENFTRASAKTKENLQDLYASRGDHYSDRLIRFLCDKSSDYSEYTEATDGVSQYKPLNEENYDMNFEFGD